MSTEFLLRAEDVRVVLVRPMREANIGAAARALKTMGLTQLTLVEPQTEIGSEARAVAHNSLDVLDNATRVKTLTEALADRPLCVGTTARHGRDRMTPIKLRRFVEDVLPGYLPGRLALIFGNEESGLSNDELDHCQFAVEIPTGELFHSLNLSHAVMVVCYELLCAMQQAELEPRRASVKKSRERASEQRMQGLYHGIEEFLTDIGYPSSSSLHRAMADVKRVLGPTHVTQRDAQTLLGMFRHIRYLLRTKQS
jgi:tRNA (cytidine32/uridine32-2'-O)-methyltransferase